jgi:hypothetical protein
VSSRISWAYGTQAAGSTRNSQLLGALLLLLLLLLPVSWASRSGAAGLLLRSAVAGLLPVLLCRTDDRLCQAACLWLWLLRVQGPGALLQVCKV